MFESIKLGRWLGIDLFVHPTFWLLPLFVLVSEAGASTGALAFELLFLFAVFGCVALHEFGHAFAAAANGIRTRHITLYPMGGVAALEGMPRKPVQEIAVALAGPAVNILIAAGLFAVLLGGDIALSLATLSTPDTVDAFLGQLLFANLFLAVFNLLPAFPMDGGRVLRAVLATRMSRLRATEIAVTVGTVLAGLLLVGGLWLGRLGLILIAVVVWMLGRSELAALRAEAERRAFERRNRTRSDTPTEEPTATAADLAARRFTGLVWDDAHRVWVRWVNGVPVAVLRV
ncbi:MAG: M50 family metallopeptidase [Gemmata sp.]